MGSEILEAYQAILTGNDPGLNSVFRAVDAPDIFDLINTREITARLALVFDDRSRFPGQPHLRRWRPTVMIAAPQGFPEIPSDEGDVFVLADNGIPASLKAVPQDLVISGGGPYADGCRVGGNLIQMLNRFVRGYGQLREQGAGRDQIVEHPKMRELAAIIHSLGIQFGATFAEGIQVSTGALEPPPGARQIAPALWLQRNARPPRPETTMPPPRRPTVDGLG